MQVLEVSAGTGRNIPYYRQGTQSVVFTDVSYDMLRRAKAKWEARQPLYAAAFVLSDVEDLVVKVRNDLLALHCSIPLSHSTCACELDGLLSS